MRKASGERLFKMQRRSVSSNVYLTQCNTSYCYNRSSNFNGRIISLCINGVQIRNSWL